MAKEAERKGFSWSYMKLSVSLFTVFTQHQLRITSWTLSNQHLIMKTISCLVAMLLSTTAFAACPAGPYKTLSKCEARCEGVERCGDLNYVVCWRYSYLVVDTAISVQFLYCPCLVCLSIVALRKRANCCFRSYARRVLGAQCEDVFIARVVNVWRSLHRHMIGADLF